MKNIQKTGPASPRTTKSSKQNLSTSSIFPSQNYKKTKVYVSPNRLALLATDDINDISTTIPSTNLKDDPVNLPLTGRHIGLPVLPISSTYPHHEHFKLLCFQ
ncbi:unnamed protein product [Macrosiphum euphorbiae]|uniref:Uncharacterized protein n=1 Tax=Macrosiphum euphorbiae TaxID=13131 RepID=A0AAV0XHQ6_9HEMI|nr:unnamed protein product [Macrosiphum euphorbiae]